MEAACFIAALLVGSASSQILLRGRSSSANLGPYHYGMQLEGLNDGFASASDQFGTPPNSGADSMFSRSGLDSVMQGDFLLPPSWIYPQLGLGRGGGGGGPLNARRHGRFPSAGTPWQHPGGRLNAIRPGGGASSRPAWRPPSAFNRLQSKPSGSRGAWRPPPAFAQLEKQPTQFGPFGPSSSGSGALPPFASGGGSGGSLPPFAQHSPSVGALSSGPIGPYGPSGTGGAIGGGGGIAGAGSPFAQDITSGIVAPPFGMSGALPPYATGGGGQPQPSHGMPPFVPQSPLNQRGHFRRRPQQHIRRPTNRQQPAQSPYFLRTPPKEALGGGGFQSPIGLPSGAQGSPFGGAQGSPFGGAQGSPFGGAQGSPFGGGQSSMFGGQHSPFGQYGPFGPGADTEPPRPQRQNFRRANNRRRGRLQPYYPRASNPLNNPGSSSSEKLSGKSSAVDKAALPLAAALESKAMVVGPIRVELGAMLSEDE